MLNFTHRERLVFYFLAVSLGVGAILVQIRDADAQEDLKPVRFYKEADSFKAVSERINTASRTKVGKLMRPRLAKGNAGTATAPWKGNPPRSPFRKGGRAIPPPCKKGRYIPPFF